MANALSHDFETLWSQRQGCLRGLECGAFFLNWLNRGSRDQRPGRVPPGWCVGADIDARRIAAGSLTLWQTMCNTIYYHPFKTIVAIASPLYAGIFYRESTQKRRGHATLAAPHPHACTDEAVLTTVGVMSLHHGRRHRLWASSHGRKIRSTRIAPCMRTVAPRRRPRQGLAHGGSSCGDGRRDGAPSSTASADKACSLPWSSAERRRRRGLRTSSIIGRGLNLTSRRCTRCPLVRLGLRNRVDPSITHISGRHRSRAGACRHHHVQRLIIRQ